MKQYHPFLLVRNLDTRSYLPTRVRLFHEVMAFLKALLFRRFRPEKWVCDFGCFCVRAFDVMAEEKPAPPAPRPAAQVTKIAEPDLAVVESRTPVAV